MIQEDTLDAVFFVGSMTSLMLLVLLWVKVIFAANCQDTFHPGLDTKVQCNASATLSRSQEPPGWVCTCIREPAQPDAPVEALP